MTPLHLMAWLIAFMGAAFSAPLTIRLYYLLGWIDDPRRNTEAKTTHDRPVPRGGGLVVAVGIAAVALLLLPLTAALKGILFGGLLLLISGTLDDRYNINPYIRYGINIVAALCVILSGVGVEYVTNPFGDGVIMLNHWLVNVPWFGGAKEISLLADGIALLWIVWNMNAVNWAKGVDGQLPGFATIAAFIIALLSLRFHGDTSQGVVTLLALGVSGAYAGLLVWNVFPQRLMPGYAGGSLAGYFLAVLAILGGAKLATALLLLALPTADGIFTITRRLAAGRSPFWGDRGHLHHRLLDAGWNKQRIALFYWIATLGFGLLALQLDSRQKFYALFAAAILFVALLLWATRSISSSKQPDRASG